MLASFTGFDHSCCLFRCHGSRINHLDLVVVGKRASRFSLPLPFVHQLGGKRRRLLRGAAGCVRHRRFACGATTTALRFLCHSCTNWAESAAGCCAGPQVVARGRRLLRGAAGCVQHRRLLRGAAGCVQHRRLLRGAAGCVQHRRFACSATTALRSLCCYSTFCLATEAQ